MIEENLDEEYKEDAKVDYLTLEDLNDFNPYNKEEEMARIED